MYVQVSGVTKTIKHKQVLDEASMSCEKGKVYGLVGPNGSGKTMMLRTICGFIHPDAGTVEVGGKPVVFNENLPVRMGAIIETPGFIGNKSAMWNLEYLADLDKGWDLKETLRLLDIFNLYKKSEDKVKSYSLGMRQKLAVVQALMEHQELVLLDEPTNGLDKASVGVFLDEIDRQRESGTTVIIASHHDDEITQVADAVYTIEEGRIVDCVKRSSTVKASNGEDAEEAGDSAD